MMRFSLVLICTAAVALVGCKHPLRTSQPCTAPMMMEQGPGVGGPGPGVMGMAGMGCVGAPGGASSQVAFVGPEGMQVAWDVAMAGQFDSEPLICPGRSNFPQAAVYRLKLTNIPGREGIELYPTLEVGPCMPRTQAFLAHNAIPIQFTEADFDQVLSNNFVTKVIYLPDPEYQELALAGVETLVSTRLDPGVDPIVEADRRGAILAVLRLGNKDLQVPGETMTDGQVIQTNYQGAAAPTGMPMPAAGGCAPGAVVGSPPYYVSGVTGPQYGMPTCGTPIGLPGPPHVPLGMAPGLTKHTIKNRTRVHMPSPTNHFRMVVKQTPGYSFPKPVNSMRIHERRIAPKCGPGMCCGTCPTGNCSGGMCTTGTCSTGGCGTGEYMIPAGEEAVVTEAP